MSGLSDSISSDFAEFLSERGVDVLWKGQAFRALISEPGMEFSVGSGQIDLKAPLTVRALRTAFDGGVLPKARERVSIEGRERIILGVTVRPGHPIVTFSTDAA